MLCLIYGTQSGVSHKWVHAYLYAHVYLSNSLQLVKNPLISMKRTCSCMYYYTLWHGIMIKCNNSKKKAMPSTWFLCSARRDNGDNSHVWGRVKLERIRLMQTSLIRPIYFSEILKLLFFFSQPSVTNHLFLFRRLFAVNNILWEHPVRAFDTWRGRVGVGRSVGFQAA